MNYSDAKFLIETERRRGEMALAAQHLMVKEAQRAGMKISPLLSLSNVNISLLAVALAHSLDWLGHLFARLELPVTVSLCFRSFGSVCGKPIEPLLKLIS